METLLRLRPWVPRAGRALQGRPPSPLCRSLCSFSSSSSLGPCPSPPGHLLPKSSASRSEQGLQVMPMFSSPQRYATSALQRFGFSTSTPQQDDKETNKPANDGGNKNAGADTGASNEADNVPGTEKAHDADSEDLDLSKEDLVKLLLEKDESLKSKDLEVKDMKDKVLRTYAEMENVIARTKRESENTKKYAIQNFSKSLLDVADNLSRASSVVKESFSKIDTSNSSDEAAPLLKTLLEGVEMTEKQLGEVFKKFGVEKFDPLQEKFDPNRHYALFQIPDPSKPSGTVAAVVKVGYMLHDRVLRPAEVGVTEGGPTEEPEENSSKSE